MKSAKLRGKNSLRAREHRVVSYHQVPECRGEERVEDRVHTGVGVGQHVAHDLDKGDIQYKV